jgi:hypothetical protein
MTAAEYHALPFLSAGLARIILAQSPLHAWTASRLNPDYVAEEKKEFDLGTAAHAMLLEGDAGLAVIDPALYRSKPTKANPDGNIPKGWTNDAIREARDAARANGRTPVLPSDMAEIEQMVKVARQAIADCPDLSGLTLIDGAPEQTITWQEGDVWCKARPDWMSHDRRIQISYKTTGGSANPSGFDRMIDQMGYDLQDALYLRGNRATGAPDDCRSITLCQENTAPYACAWTALDPAFMAIADEKVEAAIALWRQCTKSGRWPGYSPRIHWIAPPPWALARWDERATIDALVREFGPDPVQEKQGLQP